MSAGEERAELDRLRKRVADLERLLETRVGRTVHEREHAGAERVLQESQERFRQLAENIRDVFWMTDPEKNRMIYISPGYEEVWGRSCESLYAAPRTWLDAIHPEDRDRILQAALSKQVTGEYDEEYRIVRPDGSIRWIWDRAFPIRDDSGAVYRIAGIAEDITQRKRLEEALEKSSRDLQTIIQASPLAFIALDADGNVTTWNAAARRIFGWTEQEVLGRPLPYVPDDKQDESDTLWESAMRGKFLEGVEIRRRRRDGTMIDLALWAAPLCDANGNVISTIGLLADISEHKRGEEALRKSVERFELTVQGSRDGLWDAWAMPGDPFAPGNPIYYSPRFKELLGYADDEFENVIASWASRLHPEDRERVFTALRNHLERRVPYDIEYRMFTKNGECRWFAARGQAIWNQEGQPVRMSGSFSDITERKRLEEHLRQAAKMEAVGRLAGGVAHDFNNLLTVIIGHSERLLKALGADDRHRRSVEGIRQAADRAASLTSQLLAFSRKQVIQPKLLDMNAAVSGLTPLLRRLIGENIRLVATLEPRPCLVKADPGQVEQVLMNLAVNARDAMPQGGTLTIGTSITLSEGGAGPGQGDLPAGPYVCLTVRDTGLGMDAETKAHLFEPFFTTKERGKGTGLGLATVYGIVVQSGGTIEVDSSPELGTTFTVLLPRAAESLQTEKAAGPPAVETSHTETILLVEDDALVREFLCDLLEGLGYRVLTAASGEQALQLCETGKEPFHVLLTDVVIPDMSGRVLAERAVALRPEMRVLFMSGYTDDVMLRHGVSEASAAFLQKPFRSNVLASKIREVLDAPRKRSP